MKNRGCLSGNSQTEEWVGRVVFAEIIGKGITELNSFFDRGISERGSIGKRL